MRNRVQLLICAMCLIGTTLACADLRRADEAFHTGDLARARSDWEELARRGFPEAEFRLGRAISRGQIAGTALEARDRLTRAFELGLDKAALELGVLYGDETHSIHSMETSMEWLRRSSALGSLAASRRIALNVLVGRGAQRDVPGALVELERLVALGDLESGYQSGLAYEAGHGTSPDFSAAARWYAIAADQGHQNAAVQLARLRLSGRGVARDDRLALRTLEVAAESGNLRAAKTLSEVYADPAFSAHDPRRAELWREREDRLRQLSRVPAVAPVPANGRTSWDGSLEALRRQAQSGNPSAAVALGDLYLRRSDDLPSARADAIRWYRVGAQGGSVEAQSLLGRLLAPTRRGVKAAPEAVSWLESAAHSGDAAALRALGELHANGNIAGGGSVEAAAYFLAAARAGDSGSLRRALELIDRLSTQETDRAYERSRALAP